MFDRVVVVDWSASSAPTSGPDSIWIACRDRHGPAAPPVNLPTRAAAVEHLVDLLDVPGRVLAGFDFAFGYPAGFAAAAGLTGEPWSATWAWLAEQLTDDDRNRNNRFAVAAVLNQRLGRAHFWGSPAAHEGTWLPRRRPTWGPEHLPAHRSTERALLQEGLRPFTVWQLLGAGAVGSQTLTGIAALARLRTHRRLAGRVRVWPFETGLQVPVGDDAIVLAEVWPSAVPFRHVAHDVKDAQQVVALADALADASSAMFTPDVPAARLAAVMTEEGWVLRPAG